MLRSLFAGISGLRVNQIALDVTGNNIANANTIGFKSSQTVFQDTLSQMLTASSGANTANNRGGTNPIQVGLGVQIAATSTNFTQGSNQTTGGPTDMMIQGDGMFVIRRGNEITYTRAGAFAFDEAGFLVNPGGGLVQGAVSNGATPPVYTLTNIKLPTVNGTSELASYEIGRDGTLTCTFDDGTTTTPFTVAIADFVNPMGLAKAGETSFVETANSGVAEIGIAGGGRRGELVTGALEMSNVDLAAEFTNLILAQRGFQASSRVITTSDQVLEDLVNIKR